MKTLEEQLRERLQQFKKGEIAAREEGQSKDALIFYSHAQECKAILIALKKHRGYLMEYLRKKNANACIEADRAKNCNDNIMSFYWLGVAQAAKDLAQLITYHEEGDF